MEKTTCPHCQQQTITTMQKFKAGKWLDVYCGECKGRSSNQPIVSALMYFIYIWDLTFFGFMAVHEDDMIYIIVMVVIAVILEFFMHYIPLSRLRSKASTT